MTIDFLKPFKIFFSAVISDVVAKKTEAIRKEFSDKEIIRINDHRVRESMFEDYIKKTSNDLAEIKADLKVVNRIEDAQKQQWEIIRSLQTEVAVIHERLPKTIKRKRES